MDDFFSKRVAYYRRTMGLNQRDFARSLDVTPSTVSFWESGTYRPSDESIRKIERLCKLRKGQFAKALPRRRPCCPTCGKPMLKRLRRRAADGLR